MPLPFQPESHEQARRRFNAALEHVWLNAEAPDAEPSRTNVFDFLDGLRIVAFRGEVANSKPAVHLAFNAMPGSLIEQEFKTIALARLVTDETKRRRTRWIQRIIRRVTLNPDMFRPLRLTICGSVLRAIEVGPAEEHAERYPTWCGVGK